MPDFDILGPNPYGAQPGSFGQGLYQSLAAQQGGGILQGQGMAPQPGAPISGLVAGALGLPTTGGANPGMSYLAQGQGQQPGGMQGQPPQQQFQQMSPLLAGIIGAPQPGSLAGAATAGGQGMQPQGSNLGTGMGGLLRAMIYNGQSQDV